jgi:hypothetical protein
MSAAQMIASIKRHIGYLLPSELELLGPSERELRSVQRSREIAKRMCVRLPGATA